jgi:hypothetical protein
MNNENKQKLKESKIKMPPLKTKYQNNDINKISEFYKIKKNIDLNPKKIIVSRNSNPNLLGGINKSDETNLENSHKGILKNSNQNFIKKSKSVKFNENQPEKFFFSGNKCKYKNESDNNNKINSIDNDLQQINDINEKAYCTCICQIF